MCESGLIISNRTDAGTVSKLTFWKNLGLPVLESRNLFVLAEANPANQLLPHMAFHDVRHICLLDGVDDDPELAHYAPYLMEAEPQGFDDWLVAHTDTVPHTVIQTTLSFEELASHLKTLCKVLDDEQDSILYFRVGDSRSFYFLLKAFSMDHNSLTDIFAAGWIDGFLFQNPATGLLKYTRFNYGPIKDVDYEKENYLLWHTPEKKIK